MLSEKKNTTVIKAVLKKQKFIQSILNQSFTRLSF